MRVHVRIEGDPFERARRPVVVLDTELFDEAAAVAPAFELAGSLGIPREKMPQIAGDDFDDFIDYLRTDAELSVRKGTRAVGNVKPTQDRIDPEKVGKMRNKPISELRQPIVISSDGYLLDGHHRWAALVQRDPSIKLNVWQVDCSMIELLKIAKRFEGSFTRKYGESIEG